MNGPGVMFVNGRSDLDEYDQLGAAGVAFTDRLLVNVTYPNGAAGLSQAGFILSVLALSIFIVSEICSM
ncbi:hypothetical protein LNP74_22770 [Klebsiella pneumoniae subsp. pneumoniae]|nr:hypothetical protein [Klebsiella pneumoniae subsp. pneumoniae]